MIPKSGGKLHRPGVATITDRVVQASLKWVTHSSEYVIKEQFNGAFRF
jgi:RNA-directed DNA polymerase